MNTGENQTMIKTLEKSAKTEDEAIAAALSELGVERDAVSVEILERAKSGFFGIGASNAVVRVSYEVQEDPYAAVRSFVGGLLERMGVEAQIEITERENGGITVNLSGENMGAVIGRRGETLDAIQHLTNYAVNRGSDKHLHISVDAERYRAKREESLVRLAEKMAAKVIKYKRSMALEPMNSYERHVIHTALQNYEGVSTSSTGTEPNRRVVVSYERTAQPQRAPRAPHPAQQQSAQSTPQQPSSNKPVSREWS